MHINGGSYESTESPDGLGLERGPGWMQQPVRYGDLVLSGETISTRVPDTGLAPVDNWPAACSLIEQDEVGSLLPGAKVNLVAKDVEVISTSRDDVLIPDSQCQVDTHQPGGRQNYPDIIWIDVVAWVLLRRSRTGWLASPRPRRRTSETLSVLSSATASAGPTEIDPIAALSTGSAGVPVSGSIGATTVFSDADTESAAVLQWYERVVKPAARAVGAHVPR